MFHLLAAIAAIAPAVDLTAPLPPTLPWTGASERLIAAPADPWITPAEARGFEATPSYAETRAYIDRLVAASPLLSIETFGRTPQGRELYAVRAAKPGGRRKPVVLAQAGIHAGEIDGKDAGLMLLRDIALRGKDRLLDRADLVFVPIFNADGHERASPFNRPNQRGPRNQGWRTTAQNLNLNRDYVKADTPEMRAMIGLLRKYRPALYLDLHVTDGTDYQYDITFAFPGWGGFYAHSPNIGRWLDRAYRPAVTSALARAGHIPGLYIDADARNPDKGVNLFADSPRFSTGYGDLARIPTVLLETHSLKPYRQRVLGTYVFVEESLRLVGAEGRRIAAAIAADRASRPRTEILSWKAAPKPLYVIPDFKGIAHDTYASPASGRREIRWLGRPVTQRMPVLGQVPDKVVTLPAAWWVPASKPEVIALLRLHGIAFETLAAPRTVALDMVRLAEPKLSATANEGHVPLAANGFIHARRDETFAAGSVRVPSAQPLGLLAAAMLEPEGPDSLLAWNFFPEILQRTEYIEPYAIAPLADRMLAADPKLKAEFDAKLKADPKFAADPAARLAWFYERTPYYDERFLLYPVGRELAR
jgi:murein tripeptide amidase MpaA